MIGFDPISIVAKAGKIAGTIFKKVGKKTIDDTAKITDKIVDGSLKNSFDKLKEEGKIGLKKAGKLGASTFKDLGNEAGFQLNSLEYTKRVLMGESPIINSRFGKNSPASKVLKKFGVIRKTDNNLIGYEFTGLGKALAIGASLASGTKDAVKDFNESRMGYNDGSVYTNAPVMNMNGQTFQTMGASYADNAGATGDLGFALHDQRHSGYV